MDRNSISLNVYAVLEIVWVSAHDVCFACAFFIYHFKTKHGL